MKVKAIRLPEDYEIKADYDSPVWSSKEYGMCEALEGKAPKRKSFFKIGFNSKYVVAIYNSEFERIENKFEKYNDPIYDGEAVEIFLSPEHDKTLYYEIELSPDNLVFQALIRNVKGFVPYMQPKQTVKTATGINGNFWCGEIAIPWSELQHDPKEGDCFLFNAYRIDHSDEMLTHEEKDVNYYSFSPVMNESFHTPDKFAELEL